MSLRLNPAVICFSSRIGAGKSSLATSLGEFLGWAHASFGDYVREVANIRRLGESREALQQIGEELVSSSLEPFTRAVLSRAAWQHGCTIDGIRHVQVLDLITKVVEPLPVFLIFIDIEENIRRQRLLNRRMTDAEINTADQHSTEMQVKTLLRERADLRVNGTKDIPELIDEIVAWLQSARPSF